MSRVTVDFDLVKKKVLTYRTLTHRAMNSEGLWLHLNGKEVTPRESERWLGTATQFDNINRLHGGQLIPVEAHKEKYTVGTLK